MESCTATESRCATNVIHERAAHVVSSYSDADNLLLRHSAAAHSRFFDRVASAPVSYTHLTLPTKRIV